MLQKILLVVSLTTLLAALGTCETSVKGEDKNDSNPITLSDELNDEVDSGTEIWDEPPDPSEPYGKKDNEASLNDEEDLKVFEKE